MLEAAITKIYPGFRLETEFALNRETMLLCGPSGSGKTTLLRCLAGLEQPDRGYIIFNNRFLFRDKGSSIAPSKRCTALMSQEDTLFPHLTVTENILYSKNRHRHPLDYSRELLEKLCLTAFANSYPHSLSGGEKRRVMLARTLISKPDIMLLDEPFSGLDAALSQKVSSLLYNYYLEHRPVLLIASHIRQELVGWSGQKLTLKANSRVPA